MSWKDKIFANLGWKILAVVLALVLWFHVATEKTYEKRYEADLQPISLRKNLEVVNVEPSTAVVSVVGTGKQLLQLSLTGGLKAYFNMAYIVRPGEYEYDLRTSDLFDIDLSEYRSVSIISGNHFRIEVKSKA